MALKDIFKISGKTFFNPTGWFGYGEVKNNTNIIWSILRSLVVTPEAKIKETFPQAMRRLGLTDEDIAERKETYFNYVLFFLSLGCVLILYSFYLLIIHRTVAGFALGVVSAGLFLVQAFRYHFWYTQIKLRKLGLTYEEWKATLLGKSGSAA